MKFKVGDRVSANYFGEGTVLQYVQIAPTPIVQVVFDGGGASVFFEHNLLLLTPPTSLQSRVMAYVVKELAR